MRYADARMAVGERAEIYRLYVAEHLRGLAGTNVHYYDLVREVPDFDAEQVADGVLSRMGLEEG